MSWLCRFVLIYLLLSSHQLRSHKPYTHEVVVTARFTFLVVYQHMCGTVHEFNETQHHSCDLEIAVNGVCKHSEAHYISTLQPPSPVCVFNKQYLTPVTLVSRSVYLPDNLFFPPSHELDTFRWRSLCRLQVGHQSEWDGGHRYDGTSEKVSKHNLPCVCDLAHSVQTATTTLQLGSRYAMTQFSRYWAVVVTLNWVWTLQNEVILKQEHTKTELLTRLKTRVCFGNNKQFLLKPAVWDFCLPLWYWEL